MKQKSTGIKQYNIGRKNESKAGTQSPIPFDKNFFFIQIAVVFFLLAILFGRNTQIENPSGKNPTVDFSITSFVSSVFREDIPSNSPTSGYPNNLLPTMIKIKGGIFMMGSAKGSGDEKPVHEVKIPDFYMGETEVTVAQYLSFCEATNTHWPEWLEKGNDFHVELGTNPYYKSKGYTRKGSNSLPIIGVSWEDAIAYANWLSDQTGDTYRLPSESEWEYAAGGGSFQRTLYSGSDDIPTQYAVFDKKKPSVVKTKSPNSLGLYDMSGNVWEWCQDWYHNTYEGAPNDGSAWEKPASIVRVIRGCSWFNGVYVCRVADRFWSDPTEGSGDIGLRLAKSI